jgi:hypothetical protein
MTWITLTNLNAHIEYGGMVIFKLNFALLLLTNYPKEQSSLVKTMGSKANFSQSW